MNEQPRSLADLATAASDRHPGASGRELARKASDAGFSITSTTINHLLAGTYRSRPGPKTLDALAWLAGVSRDVAYDAAGQHLSPNPFSDELPPEADRLTPKQRAAVIGVIRALLDPGVPAAGADEVPRATSTAGEEDIDEVLFRQRAPETAHVDVDPAATERERRGQDDAGFAAFMRGEGGWDELTKRRYEERRDREAATEGVPAAARTVEQSPGRISAEESRRRGEESQDPGGDEPL